MDEQRGAAHVALIVEDDAGVSAALVELVESLGHTARTAVTLQAATEEIDRGGYCYVLLDMQIPASAGKAPLMSAGKTALGLARKRAPEKAESGAWALPVIVVTSYSRDPDFVWEMSEEGASAFIAKPFEKGIDAVGTKILSVLARARRANHADCDPSRGPTERVAEEHRGASNSRPAATSESSEKVRLSISGAAMGRRMQVTVNGEACGLQATSFELLLRVVGLHLRRPGVYHEKVALRFEHVPQLPSRLRQAVREETGRDTILVEGDGHGGFRLHPNVILEEVEWALLSQHSNETIARVAREYGGKS